MLRKRLLTIFKVPAHIHFPAVWLAKYRHTVAIDREVSMVKPVDPSIVGRNIQFVLP